MRNGNEIVVNVQLHERRVAVLEDGKLVELFIERSDQRRTVGNIYKGIVENVIPGLQAAFIEIGTPKRAFLHIRDIAKFDPFADSEMDDEDEILHQPQASQYGMQIQKILKKGQELLVQIVKEPIGTKGARCTTQLSIAGRYLVIIPGAKHIGVSRKIRDRGERARLRRTVGALKPDDVGVIVRTIAKGRSAEEIKQDLEQLEQLWKKIVQRAKSLPAGSLIFRDAGLIPSLVRDQFSSDVDRFIIDDEAEYKKIVDYVKQVAPELTDRLELYRGRTSIFDSFKIEQQIDDMMRRSVRLPDGGEIVIDQTEALTAIDVNSGKFIGRRELEDTVLKVNLQAVDEIARQLRLRDIGGIIVIDFIDMQRTENIHRVEKALLDALRKDRAHTKMLPMNDFGMIVLTRQRIQQSVFSRITENCPVCDGVGRIFSPSTMVANIERWLIRAKGSFSGGAMILTHPSVAEEFFSEGSERIDDFKNAYGIELTVFADASIPPEDFKIIDVKTGEDITEKY